jgi:hypothetical protein
VIAASFWMWERESPDACHGNEPLFTCCGSSADTKFEVFTTMSIKAIVYWMSWCHLPEYSNMRSSFVCTRYIFKFFRYYA